MRPSAMAETEKSGSIAIRQKAPFDLPLSIAAAASFLPSAGPPPKMLRQAVCVDETATIIQIQQPSKTSPLLRGGATPPVDRNKVRKLAEWITAADLDLLPFYRLAADRPIMRPVT